MRLKLKNFRCYVDKEFTIKDEGLVLLNGQTGKGKTTILEAIFFALYGDIRKPYTFGATSCRVELDIYNMKIIRTCRPNRLLVEFEESQYEDQEAQCLIDQQVMNMHEFLASSYIRQRSNCSIISMTPTEQVQFIKNIAFDVNTNVKIKNTIKDMIKDVQEDMVKEKNNVELFESQIKDLNDDETEIHDNPLKETEEQFEKDYKKINNHTKKLKEQKKMLEADLHNAEKRLNKQANEIKNKKTLEFEIKQLAKRLEKIGSIEDEDHLNQREIKLDSLTQKRIDILTYDKYLEEEQLFEDECADYFTNIKHEIKELEKNLLSVKDYKKLEDEQKNFFIYDKLQKRVKVIQSEFSSIETLSKLLVYLEKHNSVIIFNCPSCDTRLRIENDTLVESLEESIKIKNTQHYDKYINILKEYMNYENKEICDNQEALNNNVILTNQLKEKKEMYNKKLLPQQLEQMKKNVENLKMDEPKEDIDLIEKNIKKSESYIEEQWKLRGELSNTEKSLIQKKKKLENIAVEDVDTISLRKNLQKTSNLLEDALAKLSEYDNMKYELSQYKAYVKYLENIKKWEDKMEKSTKQLKIHENRYTSLLTLREKSNQAEILALDSIVENINEHAKQYLDLMFSTDPIIVRVENYKQTKKDVKCKMNTFIQYRGSEYESIDQLSGGERQKCELAFELAVNAIMNSRILMLDECINNLDSQINTEILDILKQYTSEYEKLVLVVSHECVTGLFDHVYQLKN